jgi:hypothetical protein
MFAAVLARIRHAEPQASAPEKRRNLAPLPFESLEQVPRAEEFGHESRM